MFGFRIIEDSKRKIKLINNYFVYSVPERRKG
jgi:hypothetical protein